MLFLVTAVLVPVLVLVLKVSCCWWLCFVSGVDSAGCVVSVVVGAGVVVPRVAFVGAGTVAVAVAVAVAAVSAAAAAAACCVVFCFSSPRKRYRKCSLKSFHICNRPWL